MIPIKRFIPLGALSALLIVGNSLGAQSSVPVTFVPGLYESAGAWYPTPDTLYSTLFILPYAPTLPTDSLYTIQRDRLASFLSTYGISNTSILVGHSNGGVVSRLVGGNQVLGGIMTFATPNQGAPLVDYAFYGADYASDLILSVVEFEFTIEDYLDGPDSDTAAGLLAADAIASEWANQTQVFLDQLLEYLYGSANVITQMSPGSTFMSSTLPAAGEAANVATRDALTYTTDDYFLGGVWKLFAGTDTATANWETSTVYEVAGDLDELALEMYMMPEYNDPELRLEYYDLADGMSGIAYYFENLDGEYCYIVNGGTCFPSDEVVPVWSQAYSQSGLNVTNAHGPYAHLVQPSTSASIIGAELQNVFGVAHR